MQAARHLISFCFKREINHFLILSKREFVLPVKVTDKQPAFHSLHQNIKMYLTLFRWGRSLFGDRSYGVVNNKIIFKPAQGSLYTTYWSCPSNSFKVFSQLAHKFFYFLCSLHKDDKSKKWLISPFLASGLQFTAGWPFHLQERRNKSCGFQSEPAEMKLIGLLRGFASVKKDFFFFFTCNSQDGYLR